VSDIEEIRKFVELVAASAPSGSEIDEERKKVVYKLL
jgi:hypothetical protein